MVCLPHAVAVWLPAVTACAYGSARCHECAHACVWGYACAHTLRELDGGALRQTGVELVRTVGTHRIGTVGTHRMYRGYSQDWYRLFRKIDVDGSGSIELDELTYAVRHKLHIAGRHPAAPIRPKWECAHVDIPSAATYRGPTCC